MEEKGGQPLGPVCLSTYVKLHRVRRLAGCLPLDKNKKGNKKQGNSKKPSQQSDPRRDSFGSHSLTKKGARCIFHPPLPGRQGQRAGVARDGHRKRLHRKHLHRLKPLRAQFAPLKRRQREQLQESFPAGPAIILYFTRRLISRGSRFHKGGRGDAARERIWVSSS